MDENNKETYWKKWCVYWRNHPFFSALILVLSLQAIVGIFFPPMSAKTGFMVSFFVGFSGLIIMEWLVKKELGPIVIKSGTEQFDELKSVLMAEAKKTAEKNAGKDPNRRLTAVCRGCDNEIYSDDEIFENGKGHCYCDLCWNIEGAKE